VREKKPLWYRAWRLVAEMFTEPEELRGLSDRRDLSWEEKMAIIRRWRYRQVLGAILIVCFMYAGVWAAEVYWAESAYWILRSIQGTAVLFSLALLILWLRARWLRWIRGRQPGKREEDL